jgi:HK97 family phage portal protein
VNILGFNITRSSTPADLVVQESERRSTLGNPSGWLRESLGAAPLAAGVSVTPESSMRISTVYACTSLISESVASLPLKLYRKTSKGRESATDHPLYSILHHQMNPMMSAYQGRETGMVNLLLWGDAFFEKQFNAAGQLIALWPIPSSTVRVEKVETPSGPRRLYHIGPVTLPQEAVLHVPGLGFDGVQGKSPIRLMAEGLSISLAAEQYAARYYSNDARSGVVIVAPRTLGDDEYNRLVNEWRENGGTSSAFRTKILEGGMDIKVLGIPAAESQFLEARQFQRTEIMAIYRVPPVLLSDVSGSTSWGSGIESQMIGFLQFTLRSWMVRLEQALNTQLVDEADQQTYYFEHNVDGLLRGDTESRYRSYQIGKQQGFLSTNDIRKLENMTPVDGGDEYWRPLNMTPVGQESEANSTRTHTSPIELRSDYRGKSAAALKSVFQDTFRRIITRDAAEIKKALKRWTGPEGKEDFVSWLIEHARSHSEWSVSRMEPAIRAMGAAMITAAQDELGSTISPEDLDQFIRDYTQAAALRQAGHSRAQILTIIDNSENPQEDIQERLSEWDTEARWDSEADGELVRSSNAITKAAWALAGVAAIVWRTNQGACDFCQELDGKSVSITRSFVDAGGSVSDMTVESNISHPPLHRGCSCSLQPQVGQRKHLSPSEIRSVFNQILQQEDIEHRCSH